VRVAALGGVRDEVMQRMGSLLTEVALDAGCPYEMAREFGTAMEQTIRDYVAAIEASGGGTAGTALDVVRLGSSRLAITGAVPCDRRIPALLPYHIGSDCVLIGDLPDCLWIVR